MCIFDKIISHFPYFSSSVPGEGTYIACLESEILQWLYIFSCFDNCLVSLEVKSNWKNSQFSFFSSSQLLKKICKLKKFLTRWKNFVFWKICYCVKKYCTDEKNCRLKISFFRAFSKFTTCWCCWIFEKSRLENSRFFDDILILMRKLSILITKKNFQDWKKKSA